MRKFDRHDTNPYAIGEVPKAGWFNIEVVCSWDVNLPTDQATKPQTRTARLSEDDLQRLVDSFDHPHGLPILKDHSMLDSAVPSTEAVGWLKDLAVHDGALWGYIDWTDAGHELVNSGAYKQFSPEYLYEDFFDNEDGTVTPSKMFGLSLTNYPNHQNIAAMTNAAKPTQTMKPRTKANTNRKSGSKPITTGRKRANTNSADQAKKDDEVDTNTEEKDDEKVDVNTEEKDDEEVDTNSQETDEDDVDCNSEEQESIAYETLIAIADMLGLEGEGDLDVDEITGAIQAQLDRVAELEAALAEANKSGGADTNSRRLSFKRGANANSRANNRDMRQSAKAPTAPAVYTMPGGAKVNCNQQSINRADAVNSAVAKRQKELGRKLSPTELANVNSQVLRGLAGK